MKSKLLRIFAIDPKRWQFWLTAAILVRLVFFLLKIFIRSHIVIQIPGFMGFTDDDTKAYLAPIENLVHAGKYFPDYRMPGYGALYLPFIVFFSKPVACNFLIVAQLLLSALSLYALSLTARILFRNDKAFHITFILFSLSCFTACFDVFLLTESVTTSFLILSVYFFATYIDSKKNGHLFLSGLFLTWAIFCRPVLLPLLPLFVSLVVALHVKSAKKVFIAMFFVLPFWICDSIWVYHNYREYKIIAPLLNNQHTFFNPIIGNKPNAPSQYFNDVVETDTCVDLHFLMQRYGQAWGAPSIYDQEDVFFNPRLKPMQMVNVSAVPEYSYTSKFNRDSLVKLNQLMDTIHMKRLTNRQAREVAIFISCKIDNYIASLKAEKPFVYYIKAPLKLLHRFLLTSGSQLLVDKPSSSFTLLDYALKFFFTFVYYLILLTAPIGIFMMRKKLGGYNSLKLLIIAIPLYIIIVHPFILRFCDWRFMVPAFPFLILWSTAGLLTIADRLFLKKQNSREHS